LVTSRSSRKRKQLTVMEACDSKQN